MAPKKTRSPAVDLLALKKMPKPKKPPPPPACFKPEEIQRFKEVFQQFDFDGIERVQVKHVATMLRFIGFNPKGAEMEEIFKKFLEDDLVEFIELHTWYFIIEAKKNMRDDVEHEVTLAMGFLGHDDEEKPTEIVNMDTLHQELMEWGEPLTEAEFADWPKVAQKDKTYSLETNELLYVKFIENMNKKDVRFLPEPINYFKLDQRQLAALAMEKAAAERDVIRQREEDRMMREMAKRQRMVEQGLLQPEDLANMPAASDYQEPLTAFDILVQGL
ncbi:hypothetical protein NE865_02054 [Phthorimaea operculella]|nr:hypothetical protein NE865_02054 [Phthorimaea operculella]